MIRDRLKSLFEPQCGKGACVEEDYACRIIMVLLLEAIVVQDRE